MKPTQEEVLAILELATGRMRLHIKGTSPLIYNAYSEKAKHELLAPRQKMNAAEKLGNLKHDPRVEFRSSVYEHKDDTHPTRLIFPVGAFKKSAMTAALDTPGARKAQVGRLLWISDYNVDIYGVPQLFMAMTRSADMAHTPDVRTRAILPQWACILDINYVKPNLGQQQVGNLFSAGGQVAGIGDWRQEKGSGNFGQFEITQPDDGEFLGLIKNAGRVAQDRALKDPACFGDDLETEKLLAWFDEEMKRRDRKVAA